MKLSRKVLSIAPARSPVLTSSGAHEGDVAAPSGEATEHALPATNSIPQDVIEAARKFYFDYCDRAKKLPAAPTESELIEITARAIMSARERFISEKREQAAA